MTEALINFLTARLDDDEQAALSCGGARSAWLTYRDDKGRMSYTTVGASDGGDGVWIVDGKEAPAAAEVLIFHDPARALRDVDAGRRLLAWLERTRAWADSNNLWGYDEIEPLKILAAPYADHEEYREEWRP